MNVVIGVIKTLSFMLNNISNDVLEEFFGQQCYRSNVIGSALCDDSKYLT